MLFQVRFLLSSLLLQRFGHRLLFVLIKVALSDVSYCIAIVRQYLEYILDLSWGPNQEGRVSSYPPLLKTLEWTLRILVSFGFWCRHCQVFSTPNFYPLTLFLKAFMLPGFPNRSNVSKILSEMLLPLSISPVTNFLFKNNSTLKLFVLLVEHTLITLVCSSLSFQGQFHLMWGRTSISKTIPAVLCPMALLPT